MLLKSSCKDINVTWNRLNVGLITLLLVLIFNFLCGISPFIYEYIYQKGLFQIIRVIHDYTLGLLPIPNIYFIAPLFFGYFLFKRPSGSWSWTKSILACLIWIVNLFYLLWGVNYKQVNMYQMLDLEKVQIDSAYIDTTFINQTAVLNKLLKIRPDDYSSLNIENEIRIHQEGLFEEWGIPSWGRVRVRKIFKGSLLHIRTSGIYIPHAFEGHLDNGLYRIQHPFTLAHEMAHGYSITDESACNFIAYITCLRSDDWFIRYSAELAYWRYLSGYYRYYHKEEWKDFYESLDPMLKNDLEEIRKHINAYKDLMPKYRDIIYDNYLKSHGVSAGIRSYNQMILLIEAYKRKKL